MVGCGADLARTRRWCGPSGGFDARGGRNRPRRRGTHPFGTSVRLAVSVIVRSTEPFPRDLLHGLALIMVGRQAGHPTPREVRHCGAAPTALLMTPSASPVTG